MCAFVLASDGLLYRDPILSGDGWYVVFDAYDDPEIVIEAGDLTPSEARLRACSIIEQSGLSAVIGGAPRLIARAYDPDGLDVRPSYCLWVTVTAPIPADALAVGSVGSPQPVGDDPFVMTFGRAWG